jgi:hypothetical protein
LKRNTTNTEGSIDADGSRKCARKHTKDAEESQERLTRDSIAENGQENQE